MLGMEHPLRIWRITNEMRLGDLARLVGVRASHLSMIEHGVRGASLDVALKLSDVTKGEVPVDAFVKSGYQPGAPA